MTETTSDTQYTLPEGFRAGEEHAFKKVFDQYYGAILYYARNILERRIEAEDIVQEIFCKLWLNRTDFNSADHLRSFLYKSTRFACINLLRQWQSRERQAEVLLERAVNDSFSDSRIVEEEIFRAVLEEIRLLPEKYATILHLRYVQNLDYPQIARQLGTTEAAVRKQKQRALALLQTEVVRKKLLSATALMVVLDKFHL